MGGNHQTANREQSNPIWSQALTDTLDTRWRLLDASCSDLAHAMWRRLCNPNAKPAQIADLNQWENEGGAPAPAADAPAPVSANDSVWRQE